MEPKQPSEKRFALLIDADNVSAKYLPAILDELSKYGTVTYKRIYGDWTSTLHAKWKDTLLENSITPIQQFSYTQGKNATDSAMIIDAMDIMYTHSVQGFCLVSSDSDFTRLAARIREGGLTVIGMGEKKTPTPFRTACDVFTTLELLVGAPTGRNGKGRSKSGDAPAEASTPTLSKKDVEHAVVSIIEDNLNNGKSTGLGEVGSRLLKRYPDFDVRSYGTNQLKKLLDEFASVTITKEGNSVTVDLVEDRSDAPAAPAPPAVFEAQSGGGDSPVAEAATDASAQNGGEADEPSESAPKSSRRNARHRRKKVVSIPTDGAETSAQQPADEGGAGQAAASSDAVSDAGSVEPAPIDPTVSTDSIIESVLTVDSTTSPVEEPVERDLKPGRAARIRARRSRKPSAPEEPQVEGAVEVKVAESKTAAASKAAKVKAAAASQPAVPADAAAPKTPAAPATAPKAAAAPKTPAASHPVAPAAAASQPGAPVAADPSIESAGPARDDVRSHIDALLAEAGDAGVSLPALGKRLRSKFHDFRLRDLGYSKLKDFVADLDGIVVEQRGSTSWALLAPSSSGDDARS